MIRVFDTDIARKCGVNAATVASFLWERIYSDDDYKTDYDSQYAAYERKDDCKRS